MSWRKVNDYGLLDRFQVRMQQEVFKFNQLDIGYNEYSESIWVQSERDELNYQLRNQFFNFQEWLGFYPQPIWKEIDVPLDQYYEYFECDIEVPESAHLQAFGVRATELITSGASFTKVPASGQAFNVTLEIAMDKVASGEIAIFHTATDSNGSVADENFRIYPSQLYYDDNSSSYKITIPYARLIKPSLWLSEFVNGDPQNRISYSPTDDSNFVSSVDVYRIYNDSTTDATLIGAPYDYTTETALQTQTVTAVILNKENSVFKLKGGDAFPTFNPSFVRLNCYIGYPKTDEGFMNQKLEEFILRKAKVEMGLNSKLAAAKISEMWQYDYLPAYTKPDDNNALSGIGYTPNPIGARNVDVEMFKMLTPLANYRGSLNDMRRWVR